MSKNFQRQRKALWSRDPHCHWCGVLTALPTPGGSPKAKNEATIDHLRPRHHPGRLEPAKNQEVRRVLSCWKCNNERDQRESAALPKQWFYDHGGSRPATEKPLDDLIRIEQLLCRKLEKPRLRNADRRRIQESIIAIQAAIRAKQTNSEVAA